MVPPPSCSTLQKSCCKEESEAADCGSTLGMDVVSAVLPGTRSDLALVGVNVFAKSNIIYLPQPHSDTTEQSWGCLQGILFSQNC